VKRRDFLDTLGGAALAPLAPAIALAQPTDLPSGPIKIVLPTAAGGQADVIARLIADRVAPAIDRTFIIEPRPGAGGLLAGEYVARAAPDGNTLLFVSPHPVRCPPRAPDLDSEHFRSAPRTCAAAWPLAARGQQRDRAQ